MINLSDDFASSEDELVTNYYRDETKIMEIIPIKPIYFLNLTKLYLLLSKSLIYKRKQKNIYIYSWNLYNIFFTTHKVDN